MKTLKDITPAELVAAVRAEAERYPEFTYSATRCYYHRATLSQALLLEQDPEMFGCIIGVALGRLGVERPTGLTGVEGVTTPVWGPYPEQVWLTAAQRFQDNGIPWAECVQKADGMYPLVAS